VLIADEVGLGKTVEALLIARELLDRGEIRKVTVICPPHLCEKWKSDMIRQFNLAPRWCGPVPPRSWSGGCRRASRSLM
jgi:SNF2 family DNA or RNA helicase